MVKINVARRKMVRAIQSQRTGSTSSSSTKKIAATWAKVLALPKMLGRKSRRPAIMNSTPLISRMETSRLKTTTVYFQGIIRRSEEHTSELQSHLNLVCRLLLEKKKTENEIDDICVLVGA